MIKKFDYDKYCKEFEMKIQALTPEQQNEEKKWQKENMKLGFGKTYPWSALKKCKCGNKHPWLHGFHSFNEVIEEKAIYRVVCHRCFRHTHKGTYKDVLKEWNDRN